MSYKSKALRIVGILVIIYATLVATHKGEFWPFSIYPMFSKAGNPWSRAIVRDVSTEQRPITKDVQKQEELYGDPFALNQVGVHQNDLSNFVSKNKEWTDAKKQSMRNYFETVLDEKELVVYMVRGTMVEEGVDISYTPYIYITADTTIILQ